MSSKENKQEEARSSISNRSSESEAESTSNINSTIPRSGQSKASDKLNSTFPLSNVEQKVFLSAKQQYIVCLGKQIGEAKWEINKLGQQKKALESQLQKNIKKKQELEKKENGLMIEIEDFQNMITSLNKQVAENQEKIKFYKQSEC